MITSARHAASRGVHGAGDHGFSKAAGREAAWRASLPHHNTDAGRASADAVSFRSTSDHRSLHGSTTGAQARVPHTRRGLPGAERAGGTVKGSRGGNTADATASLTLPYSTLAYRSRLRKAQMGSLCEVADAPYAPAPLQVLLDVLGELGRRQRQVSTCAEETEEEAVAAQDRLCRALSRSVDIQQLMEKAVQDVARAVEAAEVIGDADSMAERQAMEALVDAFAAAVLGALSASSPPSLPPSARSVSATQNGGTDATADCDEKTEGPSATTALTASRQGIQRTGMAALPRAARAEMLRGVLRQGELLGHSSTAVRALEELIHLSEEEKRAAGLRSRAEMGAPASDGMEEHNDAEDTFRLDDVVELVETELQTELRAVSAEDHLRAIASCVPAKEFDLAVGLYRRFMQHTAAGAFSVGEQDFTAALATLARTSRTSANFEELQALLIGSEAASAVPVSVTLYTALIEAVSRATDNPSRMSIALSLYRRLRDVALVPTADTYAALIACCASVCEPTQAFAFYQEARQVCSVATFTPQLYANFLLAYVRAGYGADARRTLDVLVEAGAPLTRPAFHAALAGAVTLREAQDVVAYMTERYHIAPTAHTYAFLLRAAAKEPRGVTTVLQLFDLHVSALATVVDELADTRDRDAAAASSGPAENEAHAADRSPSAAAAAPPARSSTAMAGAMETHILAYYPLYARTLERALMSLSIDPRLDPRLAKYLTPLVRLAQQQRNAFLGGMPPQAPTRIPNGATACIAVLAPDVLVNLDELVLPFIHHYSAIVVPYSAVLAMQSARATRVEGMTPKGPQASRHDDVWAAAEDEHSAMVEHRRQRLIRFLQEYKDVVHLVSLEEELRWSRDNRRYGAMRSTDWMGRSAALAIHLARKDIPGGTKLYAAHPHATIVLVSTDFKHCGRYVVDLKESLGRRPRGSPRARTSVAADVPPGLHEGLQRVFYHNPRTRPAWTPPTLSIHPRTHDGSAVPSPSPEGGATRTQTSNASGSSSSDTADGRRTLPVDEFTDTHTSAEDDSSRVSLQRIAKKPTPATTTLAEAEAVKLYREKLLQHTAGSAPSAGSTATADTDEEAMTAELLMNLMMED